jgi:hypothetical protein
VEGVIILITPSLIDLMSFGWLFLGGLLPSRARLRFTSYEDCATLKSANQNGAAKSKTLRLDFFREATNGFRQDFYVRQHGKEEPQQHTLSVGRGAAALGSGPRLTWVGTLRP